MHKCRNCGEYHEGPASFRYPMGVFMYCIGDADMPPDPPVERQQCVDEDGKPIGVSIPKGWEYAVEKLEGGRYKLILK